ncbi:autotransporter outer membrane beta-barrel domain-containing protein [Endozoicomonas arenosclerae]|uniref:autotransporter outer membrane beta-barrel domain-containing protein n=1 Tax=Endozoicomonas arenosclerae TaxID=1633495 RepID=UPI001561567F|nr:autotransporter outer membrane beta-barrel domain-containing protein [Endozoicomonas arenosclerae]
MQPVRQWVLIPLGFFFAIDYPIQSRAEDIGLHYSATAAAFTLAGGLIGTLIQTSGRYPARTEFPDDLKSWLKDQDTRCPSNFSLIPEKSREIFSYTQTENLPVREQEEWRGSRAVALRFTGGVCSPVDEKVCFLPEEKGFVFPAEPQEIRFRGKGELALYREEAEHRAARDQMPQPDPIVIQKVALPEAKRKQRPIESIGETVFTANPDKVLEFRRLISRFPQPGEQKESGTAKKFLKKRVTERTTLNTGYTSPNNGRHFKNRVRKKAVDFSSAPETLKVRMPRSDIESAELGMPDSRARLFGNLVARQSPLEEPVDELKVDGWDQRTFQSPKGESQIATNILSEDIHQYSDVSWVVEESESEVITEKTEDIGPYALAGVEERSSADFPLSASTLTGIRTAASFEQVSGLMALESMMGLHEIMSIYRTGSHFRPGQVSIDGFSGELQANINQGPVFFDHDPGGLHSFVQVYGGQGDLTQQQDGQSFSGYGLNLGLFTPLTPSLVAGAFSSVQKTGVSQHKVSGSGSDETIRLGSFLSFHQGRYLANLAFYLTASHYQYRRSDDEGSILSSDFGSFGRNLYFDLGYELPLNSRHPGLTLSPQFSLLFTDSDYDHFKEKSTSAEALTLKSSHFRQWIGRVGLESSILLGELNHPWQLRSWLGYQQQSIDSKGAPYELGSQFQKAADMPSGITDQGVYFGFSLMPWAGAKTQVMLSYSGVQAHKSHSDSARVSIEYLF